MIKLMSFDPERKPFSEESATIMADYALQYPGEMMHELLVTLLLCAYEQGVIDCVGGIITAEQLDAERDARIAETTE